MSNENTLLTPSKQIFIGPGDYVEKYDVGFEVPILGKKGINELKLEIELGHKAMTPISVIPSTRGYVIIDGWSRYQIAKELQCGCLADVYEGLNPEQVRKLFLAENFCRRRIKPKERKELALKIRENTSLSNAQLARLLGVTPGAVSKWFNPKPQPPAVEHITKLILKIKKITKEITNSFHKDLHRYPLEQLMLVMTLLPGVLLAIYNLQNAAKELFKGLRDYIKEATGDGAYTVVEDEHFREEYIREPEEARGEFISEKYATAPRTDAGFAPVHAKIAAKLEARRAEGESELPRQNAIHRPKVEFFVFEQSPDGGLTPSLDSS